MANLLHTATLVVASVCSDGGHPTYEWKPDLTDGGYSLVEGERTLGYIVQDMHGVWWYWDSDDDNPAPWLPPAPPCKSTAHLPKPG